jgi:uncharacterized protein
VEDKFIIDTNVGKLARWLRMMGYDAVLFTELDDGKMVKLALAQQRVIITRDTEFMKRRAVTTARVQALLVSGDDPELQMMAVIRALGLDTYFRPFTRCLECNTPLNGRDKIELEHAVPPRVFEKQDQYMECPLCRRIYWRGTHWEDMRRKLERFQPRTAYPLKEIDYEDCNC